MLTKAQENIAVTVIAGRDMTRKAARDLLRNSVAAFRSGDMLSSEQRRAVNAAAWVMR